MPLDIAFNDYNSLTLLLKNKLFNGQLLLFPKLSMHKKKILFVIHSFIGGGAERVFINILKNIDRDVFDIELAVGEYTGELIFDIPKDIKIYELNAKRSYKAIIPLIKLVRGLKPDLVFFSNPNALSLPIYHIENFKDWRVDDNASYLHYTPNETIAGLEFDYIPDVSMPIAADMSSTILSREIDVSKYGVIYAGAQKNIGPSGLTIVIVREDLVGDVVDGQPKLFDYATQANNDSMFNTPATFPWYAAGRVFEWLKEQGGLSAMQKINKTKAETLYRAIDNSDFYSNPVSIQYRSWMNIPFLLADDKLNSLFLERSKNRLFSLSSANKKGTFIHERY